jgi:hypothetical protein
MAIECQGALIIKIEIVRFDYLHLKESIMAQFDKSIFLSGLQSMNNVRLLMERKTEIKPYIVANYAKQGIGNRSSRNKVVTEIVYESNGVAAKVTTVTLNWQPSRQNTLKVKEFSGEVVGTSESGSERFWEEVTKGTVTNTPQLVTATIGFFIDQLRTGANDSAESMVKAYHLDAILKTVKVKELTVKRFIPGDKGFINEERPFIDNLDSVKALLKSFKPYLDTIGRIPDKVGGRKGKAFASVAQADEGAGGGEFIEL